jgi:hypothetical protein
MSGWRGNAARGKGELCSETWGVGMPEPRRTLVTGAQLARILGLTRGRISQMRYSEGCPVLETSAGDRYDLQKVIPWYMSRRDGTAKSAPIDPTPTPLDHDAEAMRRMIAVVHRAIQEHIEALTTDRGLARFIELLEASGLDARTRHLARRSAQLWLGTTLPNGEIAVMMEDPASGEPAAWEQEWRAAVRKAIAAHAT